MAIQIAKSDLPDCKVGETIEMRITGEEGKNFIAEPYAEEPETEPAPKKKRATIRSGNILRAAEVITNSAPEIARLAPIARATLRPRA